MQTYIELGMLNSFFFQIRISRAKIRIKFELLFNPPGSDSLRNGLKFCCSLFFFFFLVA